MSDTTFSLADFAAVFRAVHGHLPFAWQERLLLETAAGGWPAVIAAPTGAGKTAILDIALFHLAMQAGRAQRNAPLRIVFAVDRRIVVDQAHERALKIRRALDGAASGPLRPMADALTALAGDRPLHVEQLRGGLPREDDWVRTPTQPTILCTTVDQLGSRLMFRGYGVSESMAPVHAGLLGVDALLILDEAHLSEAFRETLEGIARRRAMDPPKLPLPWKVCALTATPRGDAADTFRLNVTERNEPAIARRLMAHKIAELAETKAVPRSADHIATFVKEAERLADQCGAGPTVAIVVNRVALARDILNSLTAKGENREAGRDAILLTGRVRPLECDALVEKRRTRLFAGASRARGDKPLFVVATQCVEAGADFDFDALVTQIAPIDALRQRFGRLNRLGESDSAPAVIVAAKEDIAVKTVDPIYGDRAKKTWEWLAAVATSGAAKNERSTVDFAPDVIDALAVNHAEAVAACVSPAKRAPVLRRADVEFFAMTNPRPHPDPHLPLFLHGEPTNSADVSIVWRADLPDPMDERARAIVACLPPRSGEALVIPIWAARQWLGGGSADIANQLADVEGQPIEAEQESGDRLALRWRGADDDGTALVAAADIRPGDTLVVPAIYGGCDEFGWTPESKDAVKDVADQAAKPYWRRLVTLRLHPALWPDLESGVGWAEAKQAMDQADSVPKVMLSALRDLAPEGSKLAGLLSAFEGRFLGRIVHPYDAAGVENEWPAGFVLIAKGARRGGGPRAEAGEATTESDETGSFVFFPQSLDEHESSVVAKARAFAERLPIPPDVQASLILSARWHDDGKADPRFQALLRGPANTDETLLAKGAASWRRDEWHSTFPNGFRHEALSVRLAAERMRDGPPDDVDADLVLHLIGTHHGHGRPFFRHADPWDAHLRALRGTDLPPGIGPERLDFDWRGRDWAELFADLRARYGTWGLAFLEAVLRLADHRASEEAEMRQEGSV